MKEVKRKVLKQKRKEPMNVDCYRILAHPSNTTRRDYTESVPVGEEDAGHGRHSPAMEEFSLSHSHF